MATLIKRISGDVWKKEIPTETIKEIHTFGNGEMKVKYMVNRYDVEEIICNAVEFSD